MPLQYRSDTALHNGLAEHAASASASVRSDGSCGAMNVVHCIEGTCVYEIVSHCGLVVPWQNAGGAHTEPPHNGGGGDVGDGDAPEEPPPHAAYGPHVRQCAGGLLQKAGVGCVQKQL